jgi:hypothetical protein
MGASLHTNFDFLSLMVPYEESGGKKGQETEKYQYENKKGELAEPWTSEHNT